MRVLLIVFLLTACSKSPVGRFVNESEGARLYKEGDAIFLEVFTFRSSHVKPGLISNLEKSNDSWTAKIGGLAGDLSVTPTDTGLVITGGGQKHAFIRVPDLDEGVRLDSAAAQVALSDSLTTLNARLQESKRCAYDTLGQVRLSTTTELVKGAKLTLAEVKADVVGPWFDEYLVSGTLTLPALSHAVPDAPVCVKFQSDWGQNTCVKWGKAAVLATTKDATLPFRARVVLARYPKEMTMAKPMVDWLDLDGSSRDDQVVCGLTARKLLAYVESTQKP